MICNVAVNQQGTSGIKNMRSNNLTPATPEDEKYTSVYM